MARLNAPLFPDGVGMLATKVRILTEMVSADGTIVYLFTYIKINTVPLGRCELRRIDSVHKCGVSNGTVN